jgi:hypothetical protein
MNRPSISTISMRSTQKKIGDERLYWMLATELETGQASIS